MFIFSPFWFEHKAFFNLICVEPTRKAKFKTLDQKILKSYNPKKSVYRVRNKT